MTLPPDYRPRKGDILILHATVRRDVEPGEDTVWMEIEGQYSGIHSNLDQVAGLYCRGWNEGDKVRIDKALDGPVCTVLATYRDQVWVKYPGAGAPRTGHANQLVPAVEAGPDGREIGLGPTPAEPPAPAPTGTAEDPF